VSDPPNQAKSIFLAAIEEHAPEQWLGFLDQACAGDVRLRAEVEKLLRARSELGSFHEPPRPVPLATIDAPMIGERPGTAIGPYKLIEQIGEGGMGTVYMAQQTEPVRRTVALKLIKAGMDSRQVLARFGAERQALALMDHPNIAKVFDAGTIEGGRPFFVMELVKGVPITRYCDEHRLTPRERLELFIPVCQAVQHAHQKGIIHRDLKPSNVLVGLYDGVPVPKVIDFGVAKATGQKLTEATLFTGFGAVVGTPEYMSPEQAQLDNLDIDTRSDIYTLGVLLYELLTGTTPIDRKRVKEAAILEVLRVIREEEPPRPSTRLATTEELPSVAANRGVEPRRLSGLLRGELDWIVMKALEKDRTRRYESAAGLAADLRRYLDDEPVQACPPSARYRLGKFVRRNKAGLIAAGLIVMAMLTAVGLLAVSNTLIRREMKRTDEKAEELRRRDYINRVNLAYRECQANNVAQALELLDGCPEDLRGWEWSYVSRQCHLDLHTFHEPGPSVNAVAFSPDGRYLASGSGDYHNAGTYFAGGESGDLVVRDVETGREVFAHRGLPGSIRAVAFSSDGRWVATGQATWAGFHRGAVAQLEFSNGVGMKSDSRPLAAQPAGILTLWDAATGQERFHKTDPGPLGISSLAFSPDGRRIIAGYADSDVMEGRRPGHAKVWDAATGDVLIDRIPAPRIGVYSVAFRPDGKHVALAGMGQVDVWDPARRRLVRSLPGHTGVVCAVAFSPDGRYLASAGWDKTVRLWDCATGAAVRASADEACVVGLAFSPDGQRIVSASGNGLRLWSVASGGELAAYHGHQHPVACVAFSPDGTQIASGSSDQTVKLWFATPNLQLTVRKFTNQWMYQVRSVAFSPDGRSVTSVDTNHKIRLWDPATGEELLSFEGNEDVGGGVAFSPDGRRLATSALSSRVRVWDATTGRNVLTLTGTHRHVVWPSIAFGPDGRLLAHADNDRPVKVWDATTGLRVHTLVGHSAAANAVAFSPDGRLLASAGDDTTVKLWNVATGQEILTLKGHLAPVYCLAFSPDGRRLASVGGDYRHLAEARVWDSLTGRELAQLHGHTERVWCVAFSPDGRRIATGGEDLTIKLWDTATGQEVFTLRGHTATVHSLAFSPDGRRIASGSYDWTAKVWDLDASRAEVLARRDAVALADSGESFLEMGRWEQAAAALSRALELKLDTPPLRVARGRAFARLGQTQRAEADFAQALKLAGASSSPYSARALGEAFLEMGHWDQAVAALTRALELKLDTPALRLARGRAFARLGQTQQAEADFAEAVKLAEEGGDTGHEQRLLAFALEREPGQLPKAEAVLREAVKTFEQLVAQQPRNIEGLHFLADTRRCNARVLNARGQRDAALAEYREAIRLHEERLVRVPDPTYGQYERAMAYCEYAVLLSQVGRSTEARTFYEKALAAVGYNNIAWMLATAPDPALRDPARAVELARKSVEIDPKRGTRWNTLGVTRYRAGEWKAAIEALEKSESLEPAKDLAINGFFLAMARWQLGEKEAAQAWYDKAVVWMEKNQPKNEELRRFRSEAEELLGVKKEK
jgi:WD40 repeat protein/serine/threonine protein kinase/tetratricopeptide (TPR) repeat protein